MSLNWTMWWSIPMNYIAFFNVSDLLFKCDVYVFCPSVKTATIATFSQTLPSRFKGPASSTMIGTAISFVWVGKWKLDLITTFIFDSANPLHFDYSGFLTSNQGNKKTFLKALERSIHRYWRLTQWAGIKQALWNFEAKRGLYSPIHIFWDSLRFLA